MKSVENLSTSDLKAMLGRNAESYILEFKRDIPVHRQNRTEQGEGGFKVPRDTWWTGNKLADYGRDSLLEEIVAFANADGGRLLLGIAEEPETTVVSEIHPVPKIAELESRFRDYLLACVEPRLPQFVVRGLETDDQGGGVLVVEVQPSRVGPHRVVGTRAITVRRGDKCMQATMSEVHAMVLRNARRFDDLRTEVDLRLKGLQQAFYDFLAPRVELKSTETLTQDATHKWLEQSGKCAFAIRVAVCAHDDLGIRRLASFDPIIPDKRIVAQKTANGNESCTGMNDLWPELGNGERFLGGVRQKILWEPGLIEFSAYREGIVEQTFLFITNRGQASHTVELSS